MSGPPPVSDWQNIAISRGDNKVKKLLLFVVAFAGLLRADLLSPDSRVMASVIAPTDGATVFHYIFFTSDGIDATSGLYETYQTFVNNQVATEAILANLGVDWYALVSTGADGHAANTGLPTDSFPVYNTAGQRLADSISDLWNTSVRALTFAPAYDQHGTYIPLVYPFYAWTGSTSTGDFWNLGLGFGGARLGTPGSAESQWMSFNNGNALTDRFPIFALSGAIQSGGGVPEPMSIAVWSLLGVGGLVYSLRPRTALCGHQATSERLAP